MDLNKYLEKTTTFLTENVNIGGCKLIETTDKKTPHSFKLATLDSLQFEHIDFIKLHAEGARIKCIKRQCSNHYEMQTSHFF